MGIERIVQFECKVCGRKIDVTRTGMVYEEPVYCCGLEAAQMSAPPLPVKAAPVAKKKPAKKAAKKKAKKKAVKKAVKKQTKKKPAKKKAAKKRPAKKAAKKKAAKKASKKKTAKKKKR